MKDITEQQNALRMAVENVVGRKMCTPRDFNHLVATIENTTHERLARQHSSVFGVTLIVVAIMFP